MTSGFDFVFSVAVLIMSVVVHEVSHGYVAYRLGDMTAKYAGRLTLNPLQHLDFLGSFIVPAVTYLIGGFIFGWAKPVPYNPYNLSNQKWGPALVALGGPAANLSIALVFGLFVRFTLHSAWIVLPTAFIQIVTLIVFINILLAVFNLVPIPPLDGSKILFALIPHRLQYITAFLEQYGMFLLLLFIFFFWSMVLPVVFFIFRLLTGMGI
ncbi:MAG: site-2 protease family protein [Candidatus Niyogibacteria bacterium]|nr:site-2 protease family protein [Candidatus Niyogibacteria bacterium]